MGNGHRLLAASAPPSNASTRSSGEQQAGPLRVLIAEDNKVNQMVIRKVLQRVLPDSTPDVVNNGKEVR